MATILSLLSLVISIGSLVCFIIMVIKLFQEKGVLHGILGIICALYTFIWGWMNADRLSAKNIMLAWTACIVLSFLMSGASVAFQ